MNGPVICGIEDSSSDEAARTARELAERLELPLLYVHVLDDASEDEDAVRLLREATAPGARKLAIEGGHPADRLVALAEEHGASFLVVGNHGPRSSLLGSVSAEVARRAPCPVLVVGSPETRRRAAPVPVAGGSWFG